MGNKKRKPMTDETASYKTFAAYSIGGFLVLYPFCVYLHIEKFTPLAAEYFANSGGYMADFFLYCKEKVLIIFAIGLFLFFIGEQIYPRNPVSDFPLKKRCARKIVCIMIMFLLCLICSVFRAEDKRTALYGSPTEFEGCFALVSYMVLFLAGYNYFAPEKRKDILKKAIVILAVLLVSGAIVEYFYKPIYEFGFMKYLIAPKQYRELAQSLKNEEYQGRAVLAFYNPSYMGGICVLILPVILGIGYGKSGRKRAGYIVLSIGLVFAVLATNSTGAFLGAVLGCSCLCIFLLMYEKRRALSFMGMFLLGIFVLAVTGNIISQGGLLQKIILVAGNEDSYQAKERFELSDLSIEENRIIATSGKVEIRMEPTLDEGENICGCIVTDKKERGISFHAAGQNDICLKGDGYENVEIAWKEKQLQIDFGYKKAVDFYVSREGVFLIGQNGRLLPEIPKAKIESEKLQKLYSIATGRGYMWINTIPILKECLVFGKGPGHFAYEFVQNDVVGLLNTHGSYQFVIDKPHCWYLQTAVTTGVISLLCMMWLFIYYFVQGIRSFARDKETENIWGKALLSGIFAFEILGIVNDSMVTVNPVFWILFGVCCQSLDSVRDI